MADFVFFEELRDFFHALEVLSDREDDKIIPTEFCLQAIQAWHFFAAGATPCRPEIYQNDLALIIGQLLFRACCIQEGEILDRARLVIGGELRHIAGQQRAQIFGESS